MTRWHFIPGEAGCRYAVEHQAVAIVVDALRASATAALMLEYGARDLIVVREVEEALELRSRDSRVLLYGERGGVPLAGFDGGNSPRDVAKTARKRVIFTTTTGAQRLVSAWGSRAVLMGTTVNARAVIAYAKSQGTDIVAIPAGLSGDDGFEAQEDCAAAAYLIGSAKPDALGEGEGEYRRWQARIDTEGLETLFVESEHAERLRDVGLGADVPYAAQIDLTTAVPTAVEPYHGGVRVVRAG